MMQTKMHHDTKQANAEACARLMWVCRACIRVIVRCPAKEPIQKAKHCRQHSEEEKRRRH